MSPAGARLRMRARSSESTCKRRAPHRSACQSRAMRARKSGGRTVSGTGRMSLTTELNVDPNTPSSAEPRRGPARQFRLHGHPHRDLAIERRIGDVRHRLGLDDDQPQPEPETGLSRPGRHDPAALSPDLAGRRADRCRGPAPASDRHANARGGDFGRVRGHGFGWVSGPDLAARDLVPDGHVRRARGAGMAPHNHAACANGGTRQRDRDRHRGLQCRARDRSSDRRIRDREAQHRRSILVLLRRAIWRCLRP